jgi:nucleoside-diphosphate-sugar epimerase
LIRRQALVVGASGLVGARLVHYLRESSDWDVLTLSRRPTRVESDVRHVAIDLKDAAACAANAHQLASVTHVLYLSRAVEDGYQIHITPNVQMLVHLMDALEPVATRLEHVHLLHGCKWYGVHLGPYRTPARESDPQPDIPLYYYPQHAALRARQVGKRWTYSTLRPHFIHGLGIGSPSNLVGVVATYAAIMKELGLPLRFPGTQEAYNAILMHTDLELLCRAMVWTSTLPQCANQDFNLANGDFFRWREMWPLVAQEFDMEMQGPHPFSLREFMADKEPVWQRMVHKHGLVPQTFSDAADWAFGDSIFRLAWDQALSIVKLHQHGFTEMRDSQDVMLGLLREYRTQRIIP